MIDIGVPDKTLLLKTVVGVEFNQSAASSASQAGSSPISKILADVLRFVPFLRGFHFYDSVHREGL